MTFLPKTKRCRKCGKVKSNDEFHLNGQSVDGLTSQCIRCYTLYNKQHKWGHMLQHRYGINAIRYEMMLKSQNGVCAICKGPNLRKQNNKIDRFAVDHNHLTGKIRGLLCYNCNTMIGRFENNPGLLETIIEYLKGE